MERNRIQAEKLVCVLLSGGLDSAACVAFYLQRGFQVETVFVDYGQAAATQEELASRAIATHYAVERAALRLDAARQKQAGLIVGRNAFLLFTALMEFGATTHLIATGIHKGTTYRDCSESFVRAMQVVFDAYTDGVTQIVAPFLHWTKREIWEFCKAHRVPVDLTYSCETGQQTPCGQCLSCRDLQVLRAA